ncbi:MAG TPA: glycosyltransferase family 4 protein [Bacteroidia bacterium]|nr:glycosyltransferase family 4 protein [Bacteroidia bacterium]
MHVVQVIANNTTVPYLTWFAERLKNYPGVKFSFIVLYPTKPDMIEEMKNFGCQCYWIKFSEDKRKSGMIEVFFQLYRLFVKLKPDVVNAHLFDDSLPAMLAARLAGIERRIVRKQDTAFHWLYTPQWMWADRLINKNATHIVAISEEAKRFVIEKENAEPSKVYMIHNGIPIDKATKYSEQTKESLREKYGLKDKIVIGTISRFIEWKGYRYIIEAARALTEKNKSLKFLFVGQGEQMKEMQELVRKYKLTDYIIFTGWIDREIIPSLFGIMDIYLHAAIMEPFGFVISEAMANGVPIVSTKTGAAADVLVHKETCYFTEDKDASSIIKGIEWMLENPEIREKMKGELKKLAQENFSIDKMVEAHMALYCKE